MYRHSADTPMHTYLAADVVAVVVMLCVGVSLLTQPSV